MKLKLIILPLCLIAIQAFAFDGTIKQVVKNFNGTGINVTMTWYLSGAKCRIDMAIASKDVNSTSVLIFDQASGTMKTYDANASGQKYYMQVNAAGVKGDMSLISASPTQETRQIQGYKCEKWVVTTSKGTYNVWITRDISFDWSGYKEFFKNSTEIQALILQGVKGFPMMTEQVGSSANASSVESVNVQSIAADMFAVPAGYTLYTGK